jgi:hypothetical protein
MARRRSVSISECGFGVVNSPMRGIMRYTQGSKGVPGLGSRISLCAKYHSLIRSVLSAGAH